MSLLKKFLKQKRKYSVCHKEKDIIKQFRDGRGHYYYCKDCDETTTKKVTKPAMQYLQKRIKEGKKISIQDVKELANSLAKKT